MFVSETQASGVVTTSFTGKFPPGVVKDAGVEPCTVFPFISHHHLLTFEMFDGTEERSVRNMDV
jgi:hypothetical protein